MMGLAKEIRDDARMPNKEFQISSPLKDRLDKLELFLRKCLDRRGMLMPKKSDPRFAVGNG